MKLVPHTSETSLSLEQQKQVLLEQIKSQEEMLVSTTTYLMQMQAQLEESKRVLYEQNKNLEYIVDQRTQELKKTVSRLQQEGQQREQVQQQLSIANQELNVLLYRSSHDFKGPVCTTLGLLSLLEGSVKEPQAQEYLQLLHKPLNKLEALIKTITSIADFRQDPVQIQEIDLEGVLNQILEQHRQKLQDLYPEVKIVNKFKTLFHSDARLVEAILYHVLENAFQYRIPGRHHKISIFFQPYYKQLKLVVVDTGTGIPEDFLPRVFDMFFRGSVLSTGSGLGLYLSKLAVDKLGGSITLKSDIKAGTTLTVLLPNN